MYVSVAMHVGVSDVAGEIDRQTDSLSITTQNILSIAALMQLYPRESSNVSYLSTTPG